MHQPEKAALAQVQLKPKKGTSYISDNSRTPQPKRGGMDKQQLLQPLLISACPGSDTRCCLFLWNQEAVNIGLQIKHVAMEVTEVRASGECGIELQKQESGLHPLGTLPINSGVLLHQKLQGDGCHQDLVLDGDDNSSHSGGCR